MHIETARHDVASLFQSMAQDVARRIDERNGESSEERGTAEGHRPNLNHPVVAAAAHVARHWEEKDAPPPPAAPAPEELEAKHGGIVHTVWDCARLAARVLEAKLTHSPDLQKLEDELEFSTCDPEWAEAITEYEKYFGPSGEKREIPYVRYREMDDFVLDSLPADARVALVGDWGTGTHDAWQLLEQVAAHEPDVLIHLGDIYYAGTPHECEKYFLDVVNGVFDRQSKPLAVYTLTGNHDMYSGGVGYYGLLPKLNPAPDYGEDQAQKASYFALRSGDGAWQFLGMDTGLHDHDPFTVSKDVTFLDPEEEAWHVDKVKRFSEGGGRTILLSHHQLFSAFSGIGDYKSRPEAERAVNPKLMETFRKLQAAGGHPDSIAAWFWGHEHNLCIYEPYRGLARGRCIGHGAIPTFLDSEPYKELEELGADPPRLVVGPDGKQVELGPDDQVYAHGFVIVQLDDADRSATASYYQETSDEPLYVEKLL